MSIAVFRKTYTALPVCEREALRYAGGGAENEQTEALLRQCMDEVLGRLVYRVCYCCTPVSVNGSSCNLGSLQLNSEHLARSLAGCERAVVFAATVGIELDRCIAKYSRISPAKALMLQAIGTERIEALCDTFCRELAKEYATGVGARFSPGYGDLSLNAQKDIFALLQPEHSIGIVLCDSLLMMPSKSVTAIAGLGKEKITPQNKCSLCNRTSCAYRGVL